MLTAKTNSNKKERSYVIWSNRHWIMKHDNDDFIRTKCDGPLQLSNNSATDRSTSTYYQVAKYGRRKDIYGRKAKNYEGSWNGLEKVNMSARWDSIHTVPCMIINVVLALLLGMLGSGKPAWCI
uniref:uncharacterized protein LOC113474368 n=1 Tax=Ciona intestinalis TaxID=7719 RepID=UPI000EF4AB0F|nr:uncharacterized protein LOC113474368 [Ciona intestinalis]|eukprot:XP_026690910.1 uncharacterized protein LOC113474368 [Ciona intestinalis]